MLISPNVRAQNKERQGSLAYKNKEWYLSLFPIYIPDYSYRFEESFLLVRRANTGDAAAQHELGLRYLNGDGFEPDTARSFFWIERAAAQNLPSACYNLGLFYHNAWGREWNPFTAYSCFRMAGDYGLPEGLFVTGLAFTENLIVQKNIDSAFHYIRRAAEKKFPPAIETLSRLRKDYLEATTDSANTKIYKFDTTVVRPKSDITSLGYFTMLQDSLIIPNDSSYFLNLVKNGGKDLKEYLGFAGTDNIESLRSDSIIALLNRAAEAGSPEANLFLGKFHENGVYVKKDLLKSAVFYLRALRLEAPQASLFLTILTSQKQLLKKFERESASRNPDALYFFAMLNILGRQSTLSFETLLQWLEEAAGKGHIPALLELGTTYYSGSLSVKDSAKAVQAWEKAAALGSGEAVLRLLFVKYVSPSAPHPDSSSRVALSAHKQNGSLPAQMLLGYFFEKGLGWKKDWHAAAMHYRAAAARGNQAGYASLARLYNGLRPPSKEFESHEQ